MFVIDFSPHLTKKHYPVRNVRISPDAGTLAATFGAEGQATEAAWWSFADDRLVAVLQMPLIGGEFWAEPVFSPSLERCFVHYRFASVDEIAILTPTSSEPLAGRFAITTHVELTDVMLCAIAVNPSGEWLLAGHDGGGHAIPGICLQRLVPEGRSRVANRRTRQSFEFSPDVVYGNPATSLCVSLDSKLLAYGCGNGEVRLFTFKTGRSQGAMSFPDVDRSDDSVRGLSFTADSSLLAVRSGGRIAVYALAEESQAAQLEPNEITSMAFTPDGKRLLTGGSDELVRVWDTATWQVIARYDWKVGPIHSVTVSPDGGIAAAGGDKSRVVVWDLDG